MHIEQGINAGGHSTGPRVRPHRHVSRLAWLCPGLFQYLRGEPVTGTIFFLLGVISATGLIFFCLEPADPYGRTAVKIAIAASVLFWVMTGTLGFFGSFAFVRKIYSIVKVD